MDHSPMQQAVMNSVESGISFPQENCEPISHPDPTNNIDDGKPYEPLNYDELFPELPNSKNKSEDANPQINLWAKNSDMRIASSVKTHIFRIPFEERAKIDENAQFGESASSRICADITAKTGAHIEISIAKDQSLTFLITGKNEEVLKARSLALDKFQTHAQQSIKIPQDHYRFILGKKGKKLQDLEAMSGTKIQVPSANDPSQEIIVRGPKDNIEKAVHEIKLISDEQSKQAYEKLDIPKIYYPFFNPNTNEKIGQLVQEHNVRVNLPPPSVPSTELTIAGEKEGVMLCKDFILKVYKEMERKCTTVSVEVKKSQHRYVIGSRGSNIAEILQATNVSVEMPSLESPSETITLRGPQEKLGPALTMVYEKASSVVSESIKAPAWLHKYIIGKKGANIKNITQDYPKVHVEFSDSEDLIKFEGPKEEAEAVRELLERSIADRESSIHFDELTVDPQYFKHIIGKSGSNINRLRSEHNVNIIISEANGKNVIRLEGSNTEVESARRELEEIVTKLANEKEKEIQIDPRFHRIIIGTKGEKIKEIREKYNQVQIVIPEYGAEKSDMVRIRGTKTDVEQCFRYLQKMVKDLVESNYQIKVSIYRQFHKFIIGKAGANINKIREETSTRIDLPSEGDEVTITGRKENCERAKLMIQKIQNEMANITEMDVMIPSKFHQSLIGAGGKLIRSISDECGGISIKFPSADSKSDKVSLRGPKEDVLKAKQMLVELSNEKQLASCTAEVRAKPELHRYLIGRNGANIREIRDKTGARIVFPNEADPVKDLITIIGKKESVEKAKQELESTIRDLAKISEETVLIEPQYHRHFFTRRGEILREIAEQYGGVRIAFPRQGDSSHQVVLKGVSDCLPGAKKRVMEIVENLKAEVLEEVEIPQKHHRALMGPRGATVHSLESEFGVQIRFPDREVSDYNGSEHPDTLVNGDSETGPRPQDLITVRGRKENTLAAKEALMAMIPIKEEVEVPFKYHRFIIGQKGEYVRSLMNEHDVNIKVPPAQDQLDSIWITGRPVKVAEATEAIQKKLQELKDEEEDRQLKSFQLQLPMDPEYHSKIIGRKGTVVSKIRDKYGVNIQFPARGSESEDVITITGYEKNCHDAKEAILAITGDLDNMVRKNVELDSRIHPRLIGARGRSIRKVMDEFKVEIKFPRGADDPNQVIVIGKPENVDDCIDHLLNLEEEYVQDIADREETLQYVVPSNKSHDGNDSRGGHNAPEKTGFVVSGAPWTQPTPDMESSEDFPSMGSAATPSMTSSWGPKRS